MPSVVPPSSPLLGSTGRRPWAGQRTISIFCFSGSETISP